MAADENRRQKVQLCSWVLRCLQVRDRDCVIVSVSFVRVAADGLVAEWFACWTQVQ